MFQIINFIFSDEMNYIRTATVRSAVASELTVQNWHTQTQTVSAKQEVPKQEVINRVEK